MSELLSNLPIINPHILSKEELALFEANLFTCICVELKNIFKKQYKTYLNAIKFNKETEDAMLESQLVRCIINDILATEEYSLTGIAYYTRKPEDVIFEIASGNNIDPSASLLRKIIELHRSVRPSLYQEMIKKIVVENITDEDEEPY
jgi:hypothetical protein